MSEIAISVKNISKIYRLGEKEQSYQTLSGKILSFIKAPFRNFKKLRSLSKFDLTNEDSNIIWALKDINFEVRKGEILGIIGRNGAGKSTLLKILAQITEPTTGRIEIYGRVASLLEVGTGFNPELTGRENVYLNGTILGMTKKEIDRKFNEIVDFSGVEKFIETPVKRYSSGMRMRLAFAVAAFLEPEILLIDEVLAVGDLEFQKKCIGKMNDVAKGGRTVLFVSHNMDAVLRLCERSIVMKSGKIITIGDTAKVIDTYFEEEVKIKSLKEWENCLSNNQKIRLNKVYVHDVDLNIRLDFKITQSFGITVEYEVIEPENKIQVALNFYNSSGINIFDSHETETAFYSEIKQRGHYSSTIWLPKNLFSEGVIITNVAIITHNPFSIHIHEKDVIAFNMIDNEEYNPTRGDYVGNMRGMIRPFFEWKTIKVK